MGVVLTQTRDELRKELDELIEESKDLLPDGTVIQYFKIAMEEDDQDTINKKIALNEDLIREKYQSW